MFRRVSRTKPCSERAFTAMEMLRHTHPNYAGIFRDIESNAGTTEEALAESLEYVARTGVHSRPLDQVTTLEGMGAGTAVGTNNTLFKDIAEAYSEGLRQIPAWRKNILAVGSFACAGSLGISAIEMFSRNDPSLTAPVYAAASVFMGRMGVWLAKLN